RFFEKSEFVLGPQIGGETGPHYDISNDIDRYLDVTNLEDFIRVQRTRDAAGEDDSGQQVRPRIDRAADEPSIVGIWRPDAIRVFISHTSEHRAEVGQLATDLAEYGLSCFVAHLDIEPTREWQATIHDALATTDVMLAYLTPDFHASLWTDQEVGWALGRGALMIPVNVGANPYGFLAAFQAV